MASSTSPDPGGVAPRQVHQPLGHCLLCGSTELATAVPLNGMTVVTPNARVPTAFAQAPEVHAVVPLSLMRCRGCGHVQVSGALDPDYLYSDYLYTTSLSVGLRAHFEAMAADLLAHWTPPPGGLVVEFGSNDGTLLRAFRGLGMKVAGVDPARAIAEAATRDGIETLAAYFGAETARRVRDRHGPADLIVANNVIANIPDLPDVARGVATLLAPGGVFVFETQYGVDVFERNLLDTIYHEHLSYFMVRPLADFFAARGLEVIHVAPIATKGGSIRVAVQARGDRLRPDPSVADMIAHEEQAGWFAQPVYDRYGARLADLRARIHRLIDDHAARGETVAGYGASVGTVSLLHQLDLTGRIPVLVDGDPAKDGSHIAGPGFDIPVVGPAALMDRRPAAVLVFAWRYADRIKAAHADYVAAGGRFLVPLPDLAEV